MTSPGLQVPSESPCDDDTEILRLIEVLRAADQRLDELLGGEVDSVIDRDGQPIVLRRAQQQLRTSEDLKQTAILGALPANIALLDWRGTIISTNAAWQQFGDENGLQLQGQGIGLNYPDLCDAASGGEAADVAAGIRSVLRGESNSFTLEYPCHSPLQQRWFLLRVTPVTDGPLSGAVVMHTDITKRIEVGAAVAKIALETERRERLLSTTLSSIRDFAYVFDREGRFLFANQPILDFWGVRLEQVVGKNFAEIDFLPVLAKKLSLQVAEVFATGNSVSDVRIFDNPAGGVSSCYEYILSPALGPDGTVDFVVGCSREITERLRISQELEASEQHQRELADQLRVEHSRLVTAQEVAKVGSWETDLKSMSTVWSDETYRIFEQDPASFVTTHESFLGLVHPQDRSKVSEAFNLGVGDNLIVEHRILLPGNRIKYIEAHWKVIVQGGEPVYAVGTSQDVTARIEVEQNMQRALERLQNAQSIGQIGDWEWDRLSNAITWSPQVFKIFGRDPHLGAPRDYNQFFGVESQNVIKKKNLLALRSSEPQVCEVVARKQNGEQITVVVRTQAHKNQDGKVVGLYGTMQDVSDRRRDQDALRELNAELEERVRMRTAQLNVSRADAERANLAKSDFLASMSHEIRTPMGGLLGLLELLGLSGLNHEQAATLTVARESGRALLRIIDDILDFSRIEANAIELNLVAASVAQVVGNACRLHSQIAATKNLALRMDVAPQISPFLSFDPLRLTQILNNFLSNALKFTAYGSVDIRVDLEARGEGTERLKFVVRDTGIGVSAEQQERLFNPFVQAGSATSTHFGGTGLGLVISRRLAELMGGTVAMNSEEGKGTTMTLSVAFEICELDPTLRPREMTDGEVLDALTANRRKPPSKEVAEEEGTLLLVVDDHPTNRMVITRQVASLGYASEEAVDGMQALKAWESGRFGAIITDCNMPRMNGYELTAAIRSHEAETGKSRIPIIACTANAMAAAKQLCLDSGMDDCLVKPADLTDVARKLDLWLPLANIAAQARPVATVQPQKLTLVPTKAEGLLDLALLAEISGGDFQVQTEIIADFRSVTEVDVQALRDAVVKGNTTQVIASAHRIKGAGLMLGATLLSNACGALETAAASVNHSRLLEDLGTFEMELLRLSQFLDAFSASNET